MNKRDDLKKLALKCAEVLRNNYNVRRVFLIGSVVKGHIHAKSDIDLVVEGLDPEMYIKALTELYDLLLPGVELNLIPFEDAYESLKKKTIQEGEIIYG
ncbi:MAG: hypothetical protein A7316_06180 [Candidatus Altiarchaeales archaeon WOR_SM1_86-2]|nr:MAG: hypothetical protein A7316_06180 [Candidatus Altiarchaeales archaeon WOR_SM1_86-2]ODS41631.1 MAG: hypothetical protein A7315_01000 [Candidatus Altiarchaeales archaeon WOR_SM1_79]